MSELKNATVKKWGNSFGIVIPKEFAAREHMKAGEKVDIFVVRKSDALKKTFGLMKGKWKQSAQEIKDELRKELYDD